MLVALWAVFAVAAVGVGFGAAGLVGDPFTDGDLSVAASSDSPSPSGSVGTPTPTGSSSPPATSSPTSSAGTPSGTAVTRSVITRGGQVSGTCRDGLVRLSAAPEIGWEVDDLDSGARDEARARFERVDDGDGRVEVRATCTDGTPAFTVRDDSSGHGGSGSGGSGSGSGSGSDD